MKEQSILIGVGLTSMGSMAAFFKVVVA